jgi:hypothetical protein
LPTLSSSVISSSVHLQRLLQHLAPLVRLVVLSRSNGDHKRHAARGTDPEHRQLARNLALLIFRLVLGEGELRAEVTLRNF